MALGHLKGQRILTDQKAVKEIVLAEMPDLEEFVRHPLQPRKAGILRQGRASGRKLTQGIRKHLSMPDEVQFVTVAYRRCLFALFKRRDTAKGRQFSRQPEAIAKKTAAYRDGSPPRKS